MTGLAVRIIEVSDFDRQSIDQETQQQRVISVRTEGIRVEGE